MGRLARRSGDNAPSYEFAGADGVRVADGQGPSAISAAAVNASAFTINFDEAVMGVDEADFASVMPSSSGGGGGGGGGGASPASAASVAGSGASRLVVLDAEIFAAGGGGGGTIGGVPAGAYEDAAGNPGSAIDGLPISAPSGTVRAVGTAPVHLAAGTLVRSVTGASPSIDLSGLGSVFPASGDFALSADGLATVTFAAGTSVSAPSAAGSPAPPAVISVSAAARTVPDRSVIGAGHLVLVEVGSAAGAIALDMPARIEILGAANATAAFWMDAAGTVSLIDRACREDSLAAARAQLGAGEECAIDAAGGSKVIYTRHLTVFGTVEAPPPPPALPAPPLPGAAPSPAPGAAAGACAPDPSGCMFTVEVAAPAAAAAAAAQPGLAYAATAGAPAAVSPYDGMLYAAGPATNRTLGESVYVLDPAVNHSIVAEIELLPDPDHPARMRVLAIVPDSSSGSPLLRATALRESLSPPARETPMILVLNASDRTLARHGILLYTDHAGRTVETGVPSMLAAAGGDGGGLAYVGMQAWGQAGGAMRLGGGGPVLLVNTSGPAARVEPMYGPPGGPGGAPASFPSPDGDRYYHPREGWQPTAMAAAASPNGSALYIVGAAWQRGPADAASSNVFGLHTLSFAPAAGAGPQQPQPQPQQLTPRYTLAGTIELARLPEYTADNSSFTAAGMALDPVRSKLYVQYANGTIAAYSLAPPAEPANSPRLPSLLHAVDTTAADPRGLAIDAATGILYAAAGGSVIVYDASSDRRIASVSLGAGSAGAAALAVAPVPAPPGAGGAPVYAIPAGPGEPLRVVRAAPSSSAPPPAVASVSAPAGSYAAGSSVPITIEFTRPVVVAGGIPELALDIARNASGAPPAAAKYQQGSGNRSLLFSYGVIAGDESADLMYADTGALSLPAGASISGLADGLAAYLALPAPGPLGGAGGAVRIGGGMNGTNGMNGTGTDGGMNGTNGTGTGTGQRHERHGHGRRHERHGHGRHGHERHGRSPAHAPSAAPSTTAAACAPAARADPGRSRARACSGRSHLQFPSLEAAAEAAAEAEAVAARDPPA